MRLSSRLIGVFAAAVFLLQPMLARAQEAATTVTQYNLTCTNFSGSGTSTAPYVEIYVYSNTASKVLVWVGQAVPQGGTFSFNVSFPSQSASTNLDIEVWGETQLENGNDVYWDHGSYFEANNATPSGCPLQTAPSLDLPALAGLGLLLIAAAGTMMMMHRRVG